MTLARLVTIVLLGSLLPRPSAPADGPLPAGALARFGSDRLKHAAWVSSVAFSPDGRRLASAGSDDLVKTWNAETGELVATGRGHASGVTSIAFSPDAKTLASAGGDATVRLFDAATGREIALFRGFEQAVLAVAFSPDGGTLAAGSYDRSVRFFDVKTLAETRRHDEPEFGVRSLAFSPDGKTLAVGTWGADITLLEAATARRAGRLEMPHPGTFCLAYSPDGARLVAGGDRGAVVVFDTRTSAAAARLAGISGATYGVAVTPDGKSLAAAGDDRTIRLFDLASSRLVRSLPTRTPVGSLAVSRDGARIACGAGPSVRLLSLPDLAPHALAPGHSDSVRAVALSPSGTLVATAAEDGAVRVFDRASGAERRAMDVREPVDALAFEAGEAVLAIARVSGRVASLAIDTGKETPRFTFATSSTSCLALAFSSDGGTLAVLGRDSVEILDARTGERKIDFAGAVAPTIPIEEERYASVAIAPGGKALALGGADGGIEIRPLPAAESGGAAQPIYAVAHRQRVVALAFSPDGGRLASASLDGAVRVSSARRLTEITRFTAPAAARALAFSPDGRALLAGLADTTALLFDLASPSLRR